MEENDSLVSPNRSRTSYVGTFYSTVRGLYRDRRGLRQPFSEAIKSTSAGFSVWVLAIIGMVLLCHTHTASATSVPCPERCVCSNITTSNVYSIDCSNGSLHSFSGMDAITTNTNNSQPLGKSVNGSEANLLVSNTNVRDNYTNRFAQIESNETWHVWHGRRDMEISPAKISTNSSDDSTQRIPGVNLDLSFNNISSLEALGINVWPAAPQVKELNMSNNRIETLENSSFDILVHLVSLDLSHNHISIFSPFVFRHLLSLQYLYIHDNKIVKIQRLHNVIHLLLPNMFHLDLSHNQLVDLPPKAFSTFRMLNSLNLKHNKIAQIDYSAFGGLPHLQSLYLSQNMIHSLEYPVFQNTSLQQLLLSNLPYLSFLHHDTFQGLAQLQHLNLSHNPQLNFFHPNILEGLDSLTILDLSGSGIQQLSSLTFQNRPSLHTVYLNDTSLTCQCTNAWLVQYIHKNDSIVPNADSLRCSNAENNETVLLADVVFPCDKILINNMTNEVSVGVGSTLMLQCKQAPSSGRGVLTWTTPRGKIFYFHNFHPNASQHLLSPNDVQPESQFHKDHPWHHTSSYYSELSSYDDRIIILSDGSLFIDYMLRSDAGPYSCKVKNAHYNSSGIVEVFLVYKISSEVKIIAIIVGILCAVGFFTLNVVYVIISWLARRLINKRRREIIGLFLENINSYKSTQITRIYENYTCQLNRVRNQYHNQRGRLHRNYTMQVDRVKRGCSHQVEKVKDNYNSKLTQLREYSSNQIVQIRDIANTQIGRIRDYGSSQIDRLRETYKLQHQHMMKLLDTLNLDNCRSIVETECMRTESMMYDLDLLSQEDERTESPFSTVDSEYNTATSSPMLSMGRAQSPVALHHERETNKQTEEVEGDHLVTYDGLYAENHMASDENVGTDNIHNGITGMKTNSKNNLRSSAGDNIEIEMNTVLQLPDDVQLDAKEVWAYHHPEGDENNAAAAKQMHTLYTKVHNQFQTDPPSQDRENRELYRDRKSNKGKENSEERKTMTAVSLPSIDLSLIWPQPDITGPLDGEFTQQESSPVKGPAYFQYDDEDNMSTILNLYDPDGLDEEDEGEEKSESDTMM